MPTTLIPCVSTNKLTSTETRLPKDMKKTVNLPYYPLNIQNSARIIHPYNVRFIQINPKLQPYKSLFVKISRNARKYGHTIKENQQVNLLKLLKSIIPNEYFGSNKHRKLFERIVKLILTQSMHECVYKSELIHKYKLEQIPWLEPISKIKSAKAIGLCRKYFLAAQVWMLEKIVKPLILRFYSMVKTGQTYEYELVPKYIWLRFQQKVIKGLQDQKHLIPAHDYPKSPNAILKICPKSGYDDVNSFRPIMRLVQQSKTTIKQQILVVKSIYQVAKKMSPVKTGYLYENWRRYVEITQNSKIYAVKLDVKDAFGNVDIELLCSVLQRKFEQNLLQIPEKLQGKLLRHIKNQYVVFGKSKTGFKIGKWDHGLVQGDRLSASLCQFYMCHLDNRLDKEFFNQDSLLHRTVDDYFFCSTDQEKIRRFIQQLNSIHTINHEKTESNLPEYDHKEINYCGHLFLLETKEVKTLYNFKKGTEIRHRFKLWNIKYPIFIKNEPIKTFENYLKRSMKFSSNNFHFKKIILNTNFNTEPTVLQNFFQAMIFLAFKFDAAYMAIHHIVPSCSVVLVLIKKIIHAYVRVILKTIKSCKGRTISKAEPRVPFHNNSYPVLPNFLRSTQNYLQSYFKMCKGKHYAESHTVLSYPMLLKIGCQAFYLVLSKRTTYYDILKDIRLYTVRIRLPDGFLPLFRRVASKMPNSFSNLSIQRRYNFPNKKFK